MVRLDIIGGSTRYTIGDVRNRPIRSSIAPGMGISFASMITKDGGVKVVMHCMNMMFMTIKSKIKRDKFNYESHLIVHPFIPKWSIFTHKQFPTYVKDLVITCLLLFNKLEKKFLRKTWLIPKDIKHMLVSYVVVSCLETADKHLTLLLQYHDCPEGLLNLIKKI